MAYQTFKEKQKTLFKRTKELRRRATTSEIEFENRLRDANINYIFQKGFINGSHYYIVDFYLPKPYKTVVEIDGGYHNDPIQIWKDKIKDRYLNEERGFTVIRIKNEDVPIFDFSILIDLKNTK